MIANKACASSRDSTHARKRLWVAAAPTQSSVEFPQMENTLKRNIPNQLQNYLRLLSDILWLNSLINILTQLNVHLAKMNLLKCEHQLFQIQIIQALVEIPVHSLCCWRFSFRDVSLDSPWGVSAVSLLASDQVVNFFTQFQLRWRFHSSALDFTTFYIVDIF